MRLVSQKDCLELKKWNLHFRLILFCLYFHQLVRRWPQLCLLIAFRARQFWLQQPKILWLDFPRLGTEGNQLHMTDKNDFRGGSTLAVYSRDHRKLEKLWFDLVSFLFIRNISSEAPYGARTYFYHNTQLSIDLDTFVHTTSRKILWLMCILEYVMKYLMTIQFGLKINVILAQIGRSLRYLVGSQ